MTEILNKVDAVEQLHEDSKRCLCGCGALLKTPSYVFLAVSCMDRWRLQHGQSAELPPRPGLPGPAAAYEREDLEAAARRVEHPRSSQDGTRRLEELCLPCDYPIAGNTARPFGEGGAVTPAGLVTVYERPPAEPVRPVWRPALERSRDVTWSAEAQAAYEALASDRHPDPARRDAATYGPASGPNPSHPGLLSRLFRRNR